jgi:hypothetical protein
VYSGEGVVKRYDVSGHEFAVKLEALTRVFAEEA